jgi:hypothetical protein
MISSHDMSGMSGLARAIRGREIGPLQRRQDLGRLNEAYRGGRRLGSTGAGAWEQAGRCLALRMAGSSVPVWTRGSDSWCL